MGADEVRGCMTLASAIPILRDAALRRISCLCCSSLASCICTIACARTRWAGIVGVDAPVVEVALFRLVEGRGCVPARAICAGAWRCEYTWGAYPD